MATPSPNFPSNFSSAKPTPYQEMLNNFSQLSVNPSPQQPKTTPSTLLAMMQAQHKEIKPKNKPSVTVSSAGCSAK